MAALEDVYANPPIHTAFMMAFGGKKKTPTWDLSTPQGRKQYLESIGQEE